MLIHLSIMNLSNNPIFVLLLTNLFNLKLFSGATSWKRFTSLLLLMSCKKKFHWMDVSTSYEILLFQLIRDLLSFYLFFLHFSQNHIISL